MAYASGRTSKARRGQAMSTAAGRAYFHPGSGAGKAAHKKAKRTTVRKRAKTTKTAAVIKVVKKRRR